jgi:hypothetical protein
MTCLECIQSLVDLDLNREGSWPHSVHWLDVLVHDCLGFGTLEILGVAIPHSGLDNIRMLEMMLLRSQQGTNLTVMSEWAVNVYRDVNHGTRALVECQRARDCAE